jgi:hypothetical protein
MSLDSGEFPELRKALKLKRHEVPPPGFFNGFSEEVLRGIETRGEPGIMGRVWEWTWLERVRGVLAHNPITTAIFACCGVLVVALANSPVLEGSVADVQEMGPAIEPGNLNSLGIASSERRRSGLMVVSQSFDSDLSSPLFSQGFATNIPGSLAEAFPLGAIPAMYSVDQQ